MKFDFIPLYPPNLHIQLRAFYTDSAVPVFAVLLYVLLCFYELIDSVVNDSCRFCHSNNYHAILHVLAVTTKIVFEQAVQSVADSYRIISQCILALQE